MHPNYDYGLFDRKCDQCRNFGENLLRNEINEGGFLNYAPLTRIMASPSRVLLQYLVPELLVPNQLMTPLICRQSTGRYAKD